MLLQVRDELVLEIPQTELSELQSKIEQTRENAISPIVPMVAEIGVGANWIEAK